MRVAMLIAVAVALAGAAPAQGAGKAKSKGPLKTRGDREAYSMGQTVGASLTRQGVDVDVEMMIRGLRDAYSGKKSLLTADEMHATMLGLNERLEKKRRRRQQVQGKKNSAEGAAFLAANRKKKAAGIPLASPIGSDEIQWRL